MVNIHDLLMKLNEDGKEIFGILQKKGPLTKNDLLHRIGTNLTTLNRTMQPLENERVVVEVGIGESSGGRKPVLYDLNPSKFFVLGIDISRPYTQLIIANPKLGVVDKQIFTMDDSFTPDKTVKQIGGLFHKCITNLRIDKHLFLGVGLGTVGPLDRDRGIMINPANFAAPDWAGAPIKTMLQQELGLRVMIDNGANTAVLAEHFFGEGKNYQNIAYFHCSVGIRTGAISAGTIVRTINDAEDAFGHMVIDLLDGESCWCGNYGCIECYSSIHAIVKKYVAALKKGRTSRIDKDLNTINYVDICRMAELGDELAREMIINAATTFGAGLANYINLLNPGLVILSGPLISHSELFYEICTNAALKRLYSKSANLVRFSKGGDFGQDAIALGAAAMVIEEYL